MLKSCGLQGSQQQLAAVHKVSPSCVLQFVQLHCIEVSQLDGMLQASMVSELTASWPGYIVPRVQRCFIAHVCLSTPSTVNLDYYWNTCIPAAAADDYGDDDTHVMSHDTCRHPAW